jgi:hypothetical protein
MKAVTVLLFAFACSVFTACNNPSAAPPAGLSEETEGGDQETSGKGPELEASAGALTVRIRKVAGALSYEVWCGTEEGAAAAHNYGGTPTEGLALLTGLTPDETYYVRTRAITAGGPLSFSAPASARASAAPGAPGQAPLQVTAGNNAVNAAWEAVPAAARYEVWYRQESSALYRKAGESASTSYTMKASNGGSYDLILRARNSAGPGPCGAPQSLTLAPSAPRAPLVNLSGANLGLSWNAVPGAASYDLYYSETNTPPASPQESGIEALAAELTGLAPGRMYHVRVAANNAGGASPLSAPGLGLLPESPAVFSSLPAMASWLAQQAANTLATPYVMRLQGVDLRDLGNSSDGIRPLFDTFQGRYVALDLDACTGASIGLGSAYSQNSGGRPDKDKLAAVILPQNTTRLGFCNFQGSENLKYVRFPPALRSIGSGAFEGCAALEAVDLPATFTSMENRAFANCSGLKTITSRAVTPPVLAVDALSGLHPDLVIRVPAESVDAYKSADGWSAHFARITPLEDGS